VNFKGVGFFSDFSTQTCLILLQQLNSGMSLFILITLIIYKFIHCKMTVLQVLSKRNVLFVFLHTVNLIFLLKFPVNGKHHQDVSRKATNQCNPS